MGSDQTEICIFHVDTDRSFTELTAEMLEGENERFTVEPLHSVDQALERLSERAVDCIVSDFDMPETNGIAFLKRVRESFPNLPFILFTGSGSEDVASDAISAGVTDYIRKDSGTEQYELLARRIETAVGQYHAERQLERQNDLFAKSQEIANVGAWEHDKITGQSYVTNELMDIHGLSPEESLSPDKSLQYYHPDGRNEVREAFDRALEAGEAYDITVRFITEDGDHRWVRTHGEPQFEDGRVVRVRGTVQDITEQKRREMELERRNEQLEEFAHVVSHDIKSPLQVAQLQLDLAERTGEADAFRKVSEAHERIETLIEDLLTLAKQGKRIGETEPVEITEIASDVWESVDTSTLTLELHGEYQVEADPERVRQLFENLFKNVTDHAGDGVTVSVGAIDPFPTTTRGGSEMPGGFYVADDGPGIPPEDRDEIFETGYSTSQEGTGFGLSIVKRIVEAHGWEIEATESVTGGARFEIIEGIGV